MCRVILFVILNNIIECYESYKIYFGSHNSKQIILWYSLLFIIYLNSFMNISFKRKKSNIVIITWKELPN